MTKKKKSARKPAKAKKTEAVVLPSPPPEAPVAVPQAAEAQVLPAKPRKPGEPPVGTTLTRNWHGKDHVVQVLETGYEYEGAVYRSLSALAQVITGAHWSGRLFFGLRERSKSD